MRKITFLMALLFAGSMVLNAQNNLALGKLVTTSNTSSSDRPVSKVTNGNTDRNDYWNPKVADNPTLVIDLGEVDEVTQIKVFTYWDGGRYYQYKVFTSENNTDWDEVVDMSGNTTPATANGYATALQTPKNARYIKVNITHNSVSTDEVHIAEVQVIGNDTPADKGIAVGKTVTATNEANGYPASRIIDGIILPTNGTDVYDFSNTCWATDDNWYQGNGNQYPSATINLGGKYDLTALRVYPLAYSDNRTYQYKIAVSEDNATFTDLVDASSNNVPATSTGFEHSVTASNVQYVKVIMVGRNNNPNNSTHLREVRVFGVSHVNTNIDETKINNYQISVLNGFTLLQGKKLMLIKYFNQVFML